MASQIKKPRFPPPCFMVTANGLKLAVPRCHHCPGSAALESNHTHTPTLARTHPSRTAMLGASFATKSWCSGCTGPFGHALWMGWWVKGFASSGKGVSRRVAGLGGSLRGADLPPVPPPAFPGRGGRGRGSGGGLGGARLCKIWLAWRLAEVLDCFVGDQVLAQPKVRNFNVAAALPLHAIPENRGHPWHIRIHGPGHGAKG